MKCITRITVSLILWLGISLCQGTSLEIVEPALDVDLYFEDLQDQPNIPWAELKETLRVGEDSIGPAYGSTIDVNHELTRVGMYGSRRISRPIALHSLTSSFLRPVVWPEQTRWYQEDRNTQIFRLFPGEDNVRNEREGAPRAEAFSIAEWKRGDGWYEFSGRYTFLKVRPGAVLQVKHNVTYWSLQLILDENTDGTFDLSYVKLRDPRAKTLLLEDVVGKGLDIRVLDNGEDHKVFVDGELMVENNMTDRPLDEANRFRWGMYTPIGAMDRDILIFTTGVYVGPAQYENPAYKDPEPSISREEECGLWGRFISWLDIDQRSSCSTSTENELKLKELERELDAEPDSEVLESYYADIENQGNGYI